MTKKLKGDYIKNTMLINLSMLIISTSGVLGRYITLPPPVTIWWRCLLGTIFIGLFCVIIGLDFKLKARKDASNIIVSGFFLGLHWVTYFYALQYSNVAIAMLALFTYPMVTSLLEPIVLKTKFRLDHILFGLIILVAVFFLAPSFDIADGNTKGVIFGIISSIGYSLRNLILKNQVTQYQSSMLMFYQLATLSILLIPFLFVFKEVSMLNQWEAIVTLALFTTAVGHTLFVMSLKYFSVSTASIISSLQPVYGIFLAFILLDEIPAGRTIIGGIMILATVVIASLRSYKDR